MRDFTRAFRLVDGTWVHVRALCPSDEGVLRTAFHELSAQSRYQRFLGPVTELSDALWRYLCDVDGCDHVALVAFPAGQLHLAGVARFVRQSTVPSTAELAITVTDAWQRRGIGSLLLDLLVEKASFAGVDTFIAHALPNNVAIRRLLVHRGPLRVSAAGGGEEIIVLPLRGPRAA